MEFIKAYRNNSDELFAEELPNWPSGCPFGNIEHKYVFVLKKLNFLNETLKEIYESDERIRVYRKNNEYIPDNISDRSPILKMRLITELKIYLEEFILLAELLYVNDRDNNWPTKISVEQISQLFTKDNNMKRGFEILSNHKKTLENLNSLGNAIKHSFINSQNLWYRLYEPESMILGFYQNHNNFTSKTEIIEVKFSSFISDINIIIKDFKELLKSYSIND
jgi:hypothetical protein